MGEEQPDEVTAVVQQWLVLSHPAASLLCTSPSTDWKTVVLKATVSAQAGEGNHCPGSDFFSLRK